ncbi:MAG: Ig-like domain-containing protein [Euryarchaeota archaeon]|nr:Ig-like domain-containing protein [Euryarchaeota archaeon]
MDKKVIAIILFISLALPLFSGCMGEKGLSNETPLVKITHPRDGATVSNIVMISGTASDPDGDATVVKVEVKVNDDKWNIADGTTKWSYDWRTYEINNSMYTIRVRSWDGTDYSSVEEIKVNVDNPESVESDTHKWAVFIAAANFPEDNESKLGNGGLNLAEEMASYFVENYQYSTSNIIILFDDGWIRSDNGYGNRIETLQQRTHKYNMMYGGATKENVVASINYVIKESNSYGDSEVFIWIFGHGYGDSNNTRTGGKILEDSAVFLWDDVIEDKELGALLSGLKSDKMCVVVDACYSGGFADKTIYNLPTFFLMHSGIPKSGRIVLSGASKFRLGYASTTEGPLFSMLWFEGLKTGKADGFRPGIDKSGRPTHLKIFKNGKVSAEEAFYYARYMLRTSKTFEDYKKMEPQINDQYPHKGVLRSIKEMYL